MLPVSDVISNNLPNHLPPTDPGQPYDRRRVADLIQRIKESADKLEADRTARGDLKILSRALRELRYAFKVFRPYRSRRKVTVFGSARTTLDQPAYQQAVQLGSAMAQEDWLVVTGAASGIMEAGHVGAGREHSMGLNIMLPFEQTANDVIRDDHKLVNMKYFFTRKLMFVKECDAVVCLPGGFGTLDEGLEVLTLLQTGKREMVPVIFLDEPGGTYWQDWRAFLENHMLGDGMISADDLSLFLVTDCVEDAVREILGFYHVYHSQRYVRDRLVFRLTVPLAPSLLQEINHHFADILADGTFEQGKALKDERDEEELIDMPRLIFNFNRRSLGRLRHLINAINRGCVGPQQDQVTS
ncbi:MAG: TIGR00730 family Rossman fold protein [Pirellulales bacterium]|nr:TIGR00730 family Rossman fold protein [Pirellulales bacterium]